jgi:hypothetical protein
MGDTFSNTRLQVTEKEMKNGRCDIKMAAAQGEYVLPIFPSLLLL